MHNKIKDNIMDTIGSKRYISTTAFNNGATVHGINIGGSIHWQSRTDADIQEYVAPSPDTVGLLHRIEENRPFFDSLKRNQSFQNALFCMLNAGEHSDGSFFYGLGVSDELFLGFLTGKKSVEDCFGGCLWKEDIIKAGSPDLLIPGRFWILHSFLSEEMTTVFAAIFNSGIFETTEKTSLKVKVLKEALGKGPEKLNFSNRDLRRFDLRGYVTSSLKVWAHLGGAKSNDPELKSFIEQQDAPEKYFLLSEISKNENFAGNSFPKELTRIIGRKLI
ncbi:MAG: hypothetical protein K0R08_1868 [Solimicrobium sp.]|jgi:hypothetical protein|nr:hypothetical protein [Solimicrobium sp.]